MHLSVNEFFSSFNNKKDKFSDMTYGSNTDLAFPGAIVPDGGWGWVIVFSSFMIHFIMDG